MPFGPTRARAERARYIAAHIMRWATIKSAAQIGHALGERDHGPVVHGLKQIDAWAKDRPVNAKFLDMFCLNANNVRICNALRSDAVTLRLKSTWRTYLRQRNPAGRAVSRRFQIAAAKVSGRSHEL